MLNDGTGGYTAAEALALVQGVLADTQVGSATPADLLAALTMLRQLREGRAGNPN